MLKKESYPFWSVAALSLSNSFSVAGPAKACGECFEIKCMDVGGPFAVCRPECALCVQTQALLWCVAGNLLKRTQLVQTEAPDLHALVAGSLPGSSLAIVLRSCTATFPLHVVSVQGRCSKDKNQRSVTVTVTDTCPECGTDHIDMQALTFNKVQALQCHTLCGMLLLHGQLWISGPRQQLDEIYPGIDSNCPGRHGGSGDLKSALSNQGRNVLSHKQSCPLVLPSTMASLPAR